MSHTTLGAVKNHSYMSHFVQLINSKCIQGCPFLTTSCWKARSREAFSQQKRKWHLVINDSISFTTRLNEKYPSFSLFLTEKTELPLFCSIPLDVLIICLTGISKEVVFFCHNRPPGCQRSSFSPQGTFRCCTNHNSQTLVSVLCSPPVFPKPYSRAGEGEGETEKSERQRFLNLELFQPWKIVPGTRQTASLWGIM